MIDVLYEDNHLLVVIKPQDVPVMEDSSKDPDMLTLLKDYLKVKYQKPGNVYLGLVHRLDRPVGGVMVFAKTSKAASRLCEEIRTQRFQKTYLACVSAKGLKDRGHFEDLLLKDQKTNTVKVAKGGKPAILDYEVLGRFDDLALVKIALKTGRPHQIRVQFTSRNHPLYGDHRYNKDVKKGSKIALWSYALSFNHPTTGELLSFKALPENREPFDCFKEVLHCDAS